MILIKPNVERTDQSDFSLQGIYKQIEKCTRVSYKSEDKITEDSAENFVKMLIERGHFAGLEFGVVQLGIKLSSFPVLFDFYNKAHKNSKHCTIREFFENNPYSKVFEGRSETLISTNYRVLAEWEIDGQSMLDWMKPFLFTDRRLVEKPCFKIITSRDIADEMRTHRAFSWVMESSRFCNYSKDKFDNNVRFVPTSYYKISDKCFNVEIIDTEDLVPLQFHTYAYLSALLSSEINYMLLLSNGVKTDIARKVLGFSFKTDLVMCGFREDYEHFLKLRTDKHAHRDIQLIANKIKNLII